jgi:alkylation response protein AidB-like acyl-CoA dehydrogenase
VVLAQTEDQDGSLKLSAFYVPAQSPGIKPEAPLRKLGQNESNTAHITFKNVRIPHIYLLGEVGQGLDILESCVSRTKALIAGAAIGICISAHSVAMDYLRNTLRYNRPLIELSSIRNQLAQLHVQVQAARELAYLAARTWDACGKANSQSSAAKYYGAHTAMKFVEAALELCGASGYLAENRLGKLFRDAKLLQIYEGASLVQLAIIGKDLFDTATSQQSNASELFGSKFKKAS